MNLPAIDGTDIANTITFQPAPGQTSLITNTTGTTYDSGNGFYLTGADYVTIRDLEIANCYSNGIYNYRSGQDSSTHNEYISNYIHDVDSSGNASGIYLFYGADCEVIGNEIDGPQHGISVYLSKRYLVANNMLYDIEYCGLSITHRYESGKIYYNSIMSAPNYAVLYWNDTVNPEVSFLNNILYQTGSAFGFAISGPELPGVSDYNNIYAPSGHVGHYGGYLTTLSQWQTTTGLDANSISADPNFVSSTAPFDLHIFTPSPVADAGTPIGEISIDIDGDTRDASYPDMGADEVFPLAGVYDVGGGAHHFHSPEAAANRLQLVGMSGPVIFNIFTGTYDGQVSLSDPVNGLSAVNTVTFQNAPGESPVISSSDPSTGRGFRIESADYITVQGLEIPNCLRDGITFVGTTWDSATHNRAVGNYIHNIGTGYSAIFAQRSVNCEVIGNEITDSYTGIYCALGSSNLVANNMVHGMQLTGLHSYFGLNDRFYYNSVYMDTANAFLVRGSTNPIVQNNILFQDGIGNSYAFYVFSVTNAVSDYNDLYAPNGYVGYYSVSYTTLSDWQTATGLDLNSISDDPNFASIVAPFDLHINTPSLVENAGTPIGDVSDDFDGDSRDPTTPDIGADELAPIGPPDVVEDLVITISDSTDITLIWSPISGAQQYHIYKSPTGPGVDFSLIGSTTDTTYTDPSAVIDGVKGYYYVTTDNETLRSIRFEGSDLNGISIFRRRIDTENISPVKRID